eukprot:Rhum_TRINITY_DN10748_c0_g1::Rhum_TRINITY_DN10748_c0_g1_i1::g.39699::m.39699
MSATKENFFAPDAPKAHYGRKMNQEKQARSKPQPEVPHRGKKFERSTTGEAKRLTDLMCAEENAATIRYRKPVQGRANNKSRCPWDSAALTSARASKLEGRKHLDEPQMLNKRAGKAQFPAQESALLSKSPAPAPELDHHKRRATVDRVMTESKEYKWKPVRRNVAEVRSQSAEQPMPHRRGRSNSVNRATSLWGNEETAPRPRGKAMSRTPSPSPNTTPYATVLDAPVAPPMQALSKPKQPNAVLDTSYPNSTEANQPGKVHEFKPHNRLFSRSNSFTTIFGRS